MVSILTNILKSLIPTILEWIAGKFSSIYQKSKLEDVQTTRAKEAEVLENLRREMIRTIKEPASPERTAKLNELTEKIRAQSLKINSL